MREKTSKSSKSVGKGRRVWRILAWTSLLTVLLGGGGLAIAWSVMSRDADDFLKLFALRSPKTISKILDRNGDVIGVLADEHRVLIPYGDIPKAFVNAVVATEDAEFWSHSGTSSRGFVRAGWKFVASGFRRREGGSTLTMQLVRTVTQKRQKRLERKIKEIILARKLEKAYTKKQIFEMYANEVWFGSNRYGLEIAAQHYFGKSAPQLHVEECALLAGIIQNPGYLNPYSRDESIRKLVRQRRTHVLHRMVAEGYLKAKDAEVFDQRPIRMARPNAKEELIAPYAVEEIRKYLQKSYGQAMIQNGGLEIHTTLDGVWQQAANEAVQKGLKAVDRRRGYRKAELQHVTDIENAKLPGWNRAFEVGDSVQGVLQRWVGKTAVVRIGDRFLDVPEAGFAWAGKDLQKLFVKGAAPLFEIKKVDGEGHPLDVELDQEPDAQGALLAVEPSNGEIRAMVGGYDFKNSFFNRSMQAERQVGSTMKAFVYGAAFASGMTPATMVQDVPTRFTFDTTVYQPANYERDYWGPIPIWEAIRDSRNVAAVRTLEAVGIDHVQAFARACGVQSKLPAYPSLALGSADLTLAEMVRGYATFANGGKQSPKAFLIKRIVDRNGKVLESHAGASGEEVLDPMSNFQLIQCLQGVTTRGTAARANALNWPVAGKTGTTNDHTDAWFVGFSTRITCGVWVGLDTKKTLFRGGADGGRVALPIWIDFMKVALPTTPKEEFQAPEGMEWVDVDKLTGLIATSASDPKDVIPLAFKPGARPSEPSTPEARQAVQEARAKANSQGVEDRPWGMSHLTGDGSEVKDAEPPEDPNQ